MSTLRPVFRHVVLFRWKDSTTDADVARFVDILAGLPAVIPELKRYEFGPDAGVAEGNFDFAVLAEFDDRAGWTAYMENPQHQRAIGYVRTLFDERSAVQFEAWGTTYA